MQWRIIPIYLRFIYVFNLLFIYIDGFNISDSGAKEIADAVKNNTNISAFYLRI